MAATHNVVQTSSPGIIQEADNIASYEQSRPLAGTAAEPNHTAGVNPLSGGAPLSNGGGKHILPALHLPHNPLHSHPNTHGHASSRDRRATNDTTLSRRSTRNSANRKPATEVLRKMTTGLFTPEKKIRKTPGVKLSFMNLIKSSWVNVLLVFIPVS
jgi:hypothetical protein